MIRSNQLEFAYRNNPVFEDCSFQLPKGSICGLLGRNGSGKTTLLKLLCGVLFPRSGSIEVCGFEPKRRQAAFYEKIAYVPQELSRPDMLVATYTDICGDLYPHFSLDKWKSLIKRFEINPFKIFSELSGGDLRKAWLCFAFSCQTPMVLLDEPSQGLDIPAQETLRQLLAEEGSDDRVILLSTHHIREIEQLIDTLIILDDDGNIVCSGRCSDVFDSYHMREVESPVLLPADCLYSRRTTTGWMYIRQGQPESEQTVPLEFLFQALTAPKLSKEGTHVRHTVQ